MLGRQEEDSERVTLSDHGEEADGRSSRHRDDHRFDLGRVGWGTPRSLGRVQGARESTCAENV
jgi:hypothetical protein